MIDEGALPGPVDGEVRTEDFHEEDEDDGYGYGGRSVRQRRLSYRAEPPEKGGFICGLQRFLRTYSINLSVEILKKNQRASR